MYNIVYKTVVKDSNEGYFSEITLGKDDLIMDDGHKVKVSTYLKKHGKAGVIALLPYYDLEDEIMEEYHIHLQTPAERARREKEKAEQVNNVQDNITVSAPEEEVYETTATDVVEDVCKATDVNVEDYIGSVLYDQEDDPMDTPFYYPAETGLYRYPYWGVPTGIVRRTIY